jgi:hypothetical protein
MTTTHRAGADAQAPKVASSAGADYYRVRDGERQATIRVSVLYPVGPLCLTCVRFDCRHVDTFNEQRAAA